MSALKCQKPTLYFILVLLFLNINSNPISLNASAQKLQNSQAYDTIKSLRFTDANQIFFSTKDNRKFGYIDRQEGELYNVFQLEQHQTIINQNSKSLVIRNQHKGLIFFDIQSGEQVIDQSLNNLQKQNFSQVLSFVQTKLGKYYLTQKDLRFFQFKKQNSQTQYKRHEHLSSQQIDQKEGEKESQKITQNNLENNFHQNKYQIIYQMNKQEETDSIQYLYDLIVFPSQQISSRVVLVVLLQTQSKKLICFKQFRGKDMFDGKCHQSHTLNLTNVQISGQYLYIQIGKQRISKSQILPSQTLRQKQTKLNILYQQEKQQISNIFQQINSEETTKIVFGSNLQPITIFKKQIQQTHEGCAVFSNHQTYVPQHQSYFEYRIIDDGEQQGNIRAIIGEDAIYIADYRNNLSSNSRKIFNENCQDKKNEQIYDNIELKTRDNSFLTKIKRQHHHKNIQPISMYIYTKQYKAHYFFLIQYIDNSISLYQLTCENSTKKNIENKMSKDKNGVEYDLKAKKLWQIQSISEGLVQQNEKTAELKKKINRKKTSSGHSQQLFGQSGQYL